MTEGPGLLPPPSWVTKLQPSKPYGPDLLSSERQNSGVDTKILANVLHTKEGVEMQRRILEVLQGDEAFDKTGNYFGSRVEKLKTSISRGKRLHQLQQAHRWSEQEFATALELLGDPTAYAIHWKGFLACIREQGTDEQHELFLRPAEKMEIIGCFCQTELGHGSNVRKLETTATWDPSDRTFILHSPHLTSSKWWAGTLGRTANYAIVMAQLIIAGKAYGPHPFVCQIRDLITHEPLDGVYVGDIGPKLGYNMVDNGFMVLNQVKVPHVNMLARFARVDPTKNAYVPPESSAHIYGTLTKIRCALVLESARNMARGLTIAIRYCAVRCQFNDNPKQNGEAQVLDYSMVQYRLLTLLAESVALNFTGQATIAFHDEIKQALQAGNSGNNANSRKEMFAELHAASCALKAFATSAAAQGLEVCRRACGGHGYSSFAGIGNVFADYVASQTYEGDNYVLGQQTANYLLKQAQIITQGKPTESVAGKNLSRYATARNGPIQFCLDNDEDLVAVFGWRSAYLTFKTLQQSQGKTRNQLQVAMWKLTTAHSQFLVVRGFYERLVAIASTSELPLSPETRDVLWKLLRLYALFLIQSEPYDFFASSALQTEQLEHASTVLFMQLLADIRPHAVKLVDSWNLPDWLLDSSLGRYDGRVYEDLFQRASQSNPLNLITVDPRPGSSTMIKNEIVNRYRSNL